MTLPAAPDPTAPLPPDLVVSGAFVPAAQRRRVLVYAPLAYSTPHFETDLEIAQRHLDLGDEVELVLCDAELQSCQLNPQHDLARCVQCVSRSLQGAKQLSSEVKITGVLGALTPGDRARLETLPARFPDQAALAAYRFDGFDVGMASLSSMIDFTRAMTIDTVALAAVIHRTVSAATATFLAFKRLLAAGAYDRVYIYNGRWSMMRSAVRACEQAAVEYYTHERGSDFRKYALYRNVLPHDRAYFREQTRAAWALAASHPQAAALAETFFVERRNRVEKTWFSFTKQQESGRLPADWDRPARRLVCFTSSEFEFAAIGDGSVGKIYPSQPAGVRRIAHLLSHRSPGTHLWVRVHPNDNNPPAIGRWTAATAQLANVTLVPPDAKVDSYAMLDGAERILTFGSTVGIEAAFWGRPAICADYSFYNGLDAQYEPAGETELLALLLQPELPPKPRENALRFGYYLNTSGGEFQHFVTQEISDYSFQSPFRGHCLRPDYDDLRKRVFALLQAGGFARTLPLARLMVDFRPAEAIGHSILIISHAKLDAVEAAVTALEAAARLLPAPALDQVLKGASPTLLNALMKHAGQTTGAAAARPARQTAAVLLRAPAFAALGEKLSALAEKIERTPERQLQPVG